MFEYERSLKQEDIRPGEKFRVRLNPKRVNFIGWWAFGDLEGDLKDKKFARWQLPDRDGRLDDLMPGEEEPDIEQMQNEGWILSERRDNLVVTNASEDGVVFTFVA